jgi:hypothetical protein
MSAPRTAVALLTVFALAGCGGGTATAVPPPAPSSVSSPAPAPAVPSSVASPSVAPSAALHFQAADALIAKKPGTIGIVIRDRVTGTVWRGGDPKALNWTASTIKLAISTTILERQHAGQLTLTAADKNNMRLSLINSDNDATTALWTKFDGPGMLDRFRTTYGMTTLGVEPGFDVFWRNLRCSAEDLAAVMSYVLDKLDATDRAYLVTTLRGVASLQHWGVWGAGPALHPGNKDGWAQKPDNGVTHWVTHSIGFAGDNERYVIAVMYRLPASGTLPDGTHTISDLVATIFGAKVPAPISIPAS